MEGAAAVTKGSVRLWRRSLPLLLLVVGLGSVLFLDRLGSTGLVDETPPLFAAAAWTMAERSDVLVPRFNGLPRYDKPPLVYWLMAAGYALPCSERWDPLGTWAANLQASLAVIALMTLLAAPCCAGPSTPMPPDTVIPPPWPWWVR